MDNGLGTRRHQTLYTSPSILAHTLLLVEWIDRSRKVGVPDGKRPIPHIAPPHSLLTAVRSDQIHQQRDHQHARQNRNQRHGIPNVDPLPLLGPLDSSHSPVHVVYPSCAHTAGTSTHRRVHRRERHLLVLELRHEPAHRRQPQLHRVLPLTSSRRSHLEVVGHDLQEEAALLLHEVQLRRQVQQRAGDLHVERGVALQRRHAPALKHTAVRHALRRREVRLQLRHQLVVQVARQLDLAERRLQQRHAVQAQLRLTRAATSHRCEPREALVVQPQVLQVERVPDLVLALI